MISRNRGSPKQHPQAKSLSSCFPRHSSPRLEGWTHHSSRERLHFAKDWSCLRSPNPVFGGSASASRGREGIRDELAWQRYKLLMECQRGRPHKWLRIEVLRRCWQSSSPGARNNFHSASVAYLGC